MITERINDPQALDPAQIERILQTGKGATIQFSREGYSQSLLAEIDALCHRFGDRLEVRFYGHYSSAFDASHLALIPHVRWLSVDCLMRVKNIEHLYNLAELTKLSLEVHELNAPDILRHIQIAQLRELRLGETRKADIDLAPLSQCTELIDLGLSGHHKNLSALSSLTKLKELRLRSVKKTHSLEAVSEIRNLKRLTVILGGRTDINELKHPKLEELEIIRVLGFSDLGDLRRFPVLRKLRIEDQIRLELVDFTNAPPTLEEIVFANCKKFSEIGPLDHLGNLKSLRLVLTAVDFEKLLALRRPPSLRQIAFYTGKQKANAECEARLTALGYL